MLKTNSKLVKERIKRFIIDNTIDSETGEGVESIEEALKVLLPSFDAYIGTKRIKQEGRYYFFNQMEFRSWGQGLPNSLFDFYVGAPMYASDILKEILEETEEEAKRFYQDESEELLSYLIFRELKKYI